MKNKSIVKFFFWLFFFVCGFQYCLMIPTCLIEQNAAKAAELSIGDYPTFHSEEIKELYIQEYLDSIADQTIFKIPYVAEYTYQTLKERQLRPGLDLAGGMQITLGFDMETFIRNLADEPNDTHFEEALKHTKKSGPLSSVEYVDELFNFYQKIESEEGIKRNFQGHAQLKDQIKIHTTTKDLKELVIEQTKDMVKRTQTLLEQRINHLGLAQVQISLDLKNNYILIEIPGVKNPEYIREMILTMASLEFWNTYRITDPGIRESFIATDDLLQEREHGKLKID